MSVCIILLLQLTVNQHASKRLSNWKILLCRCVYALIIYIYFIACSIQTLDSRCIKWKSVFFRLLIAVPDCFLTSMNLCFFTSHISQDFNSMLKHQFQSADKHHQSLWCRWFRDTTLIHIIFSLCEIHKIFTNQTYEWRTIIKYSCRCCKADPIQINRFILHRVRYCSLSMFCVSAVVSIINFKVSFDIIIGSKQLRIPL